MLSVRLLCWVVLTLHTTATCYHLQRTSVPSGAGAADPETQPWLEADDETNFIRKKSNKGAQNPVRQGTEAAAVSFHFVHIVRTCVLIVDVSLISHRQLQPL